MSFLAAVAVFPPALGMAALLAAFGKAPEWLDACATVHNTTRTGNLCSGELNVDSWVALLPPTATLAMDHIGISKEVQFLNVFRGTLESELKFIADCAAKGSFMAYMVALACAFPFLILPFILRGQLQTQNASRLQEAAAAQEDPQTPESPQPSKPSKMDASRVVKANLKESPKAKAAATRGRGTSPAPKKKVN